LLSCQSELLSYGEVEGEGKQHLLLRLVTLYVTDFQESIQGSNKSLHLASDELVGGARLSYIFNQEYGAAVIQMTAADDLSLEQVRTAIRNSSVPRLVEYFYTHIFKISQNVGTEAGHFRPRRLI
jgi:dynamin 1-like protein